MAYWGAFAAVLGAVILALGYAGAPWALWVATALVAGWVAGAAWPWFVGVLAIGLLLGVRALREPLLSGPLLQMFRRAGLAPRISETERIALQAGDVWIERELFTGRPRLGRLLRQPQPALSEEEKAYLEGPVEEICRRARDWEIWKEGDLSSELWVLIRRERLLGMIIPREYGGLGFSAYAHSEVIHKLASRSIPLSITAMVPNSLGPAELLIHYGTTAQKAYYLPRLARGEELPCFALTEPEAGSDAASIRSTGVVFRGADGRLYLRLNWNKRWITLSTVATVLGLAFRLKDPENLLGKGEDPGITCALIPTSTPGVVINRRHDPLGVPFYNSPTQGKDVVVSVDQIIGGPAGAGQGWRMLMESLAAGRGISLPAQSAGEAKIVARVAGAHAVLRRQFGVSIGKFGGVIEPLARIAGSTYLIEALRRYTCSALNQGRRPAVVTALVKHETTERVREVINDGMDVLGGQGITRGPRNLLASYYIGTPIAITVEGANIMTRALIIFGQGALRAHPFAYRLLDAVERRDVRSFDAAFWGMTGAFLRNGFRTALLSLTRGGLAWGSVQGLPRRHVRRLVWASACFAFLSDVAMASLGGGLKLQERLTGRFADILSGLYAATAVLYRFRQEGARAEDLPVAEWALERTYERMQRAFEGVLAEFPERRVRWLLRPLFHLTRWNRLSAGPSDSADKQVARVVQEPGVRRQRLFGGVFIPLAVPAAMPLGGSQKEVERLGGSRDIEPLGRLESALQLAAETEPVRARIEALGRKGVLPREWDLGSQLELALEKGLVNGSEAELLARAERARHDAIQVDDFPVDRLSVAVWRRSA